MKPKQQYLDAVFEVAERHGHQIMDSNRDGLRQILFTNNKGKKTLQEEHLAQLYPAILRPGAPISCLIEKVAPGRGCAHSGMRKIIAEITGE